MTNRNYPIGIQDFRKIREGDYHYIDKTELIFQLLTKGSYYFLSRPRRFGKSLLLSTIKEIYSGSRDLFTGLWIENQWNWAQQHLVIHLKFSSINYQKLGLYAALSEEIVSIAQSFSIELLHLELKDQFRELLEKMGSTQKVVLIIDEYDKPIIDYLDNPEKALENRSLLKQFYSVIKDADPFIEFMLITGVSKFSKVSIFSDLNNLKDLTLNVRFNNLVGITQAELLHQFSGRINDIAESQSLSSDELIKKIKYWYNGYRWGGKDTIYNPFSLLNYLQDGQFNNYWFETGTPTFLVELLRQEGNFNLDEQGFASLLALSSFDIEQINTQTVLFQTGYLTINDLNFEEGWCTLHYPNKEVKASLEQLLMDAFRYGNGKSLPLILQLRQALLGHNLEEVMTIINAAFSSIPYDLWRGATELHYHALVHLTFSLLGNYLQSEVHSAKGRCDALVQTPSHIYAFEFKLDESAEVAMQQILNKGYLEPYQLDKRKKIAVGVNFLAEDRKVGEFVSKEI